MEQDISPGITQRNSRILLFKIKKDGVPFTLSGSQALFVIKTAIDSPDDEALIVKKTEGYPGGGGGDDQILFVELPPPNGGTPVLWGIKVFLKPTDITVDMAPGQYYCQLDLIPVDPTDRFTPVKGFLTIEPTGIQAL